MNYLSLWIANFGVVPWLSFLFFLFLPAFLALRALLVLVCCVLEAISYSFAKLLHLRTSFLTFSVLIVKGFLILNALTVPVFASKGPKIREFFLAKGEQIEINRPSLSSFSIGNKEVLKSKYYAAKGQLLIKGNSLGFSDLVVWDKKGAKESLHFYVVSKKEQLNNFQLANDFKSLGLEVKALAFELMVKGEIQSLEDLKLFNLYMSKNQDKLINMVELSENLKKEIVADIYLLLSGESALLNCNGVGTEIECLYEGLEVNSPKVRQAQARYAAKFTPWSGHYADSNFKIELKVFRTDQSFMRGMGLGLDKLGAKVGQLLNGNTRALIDGNDLLFSEKELESHLVTSPEILTSLGTPGEIQLGAEIPVVNQNQYGVQYTTWKFAGLKLKTALSLQQTKIKVALESELTHPVDNLIRGSKSSAQFFPKLGEYVQAFQVKYDLKSKASKAIPGLGEIPVLNALFTSTGKNTSEQWLIGYVKITKVEK